MSSVGNFQLSSDYGSVANDANGSISLFVPKGTKNNGLDAITIYSNPLTIGTRNAIARCEMKSVSVSVFDPFYTSYGFVPTEDALLSVLVMLNNTTFQSVVCEVYLERNTAETVRLVFVTQNPGTLLEIYDEITITCNLWTMLSPFEVNN